jgi:hypothetical protein
MAGYAEALVALWDEGKRHRSNMVSKARERGLHVFVHRIRAAGR